jgi:hypothetical protein
MAASHSPDIYVFPLRMKTKEEVVSPICYPYSCPSRAQGNREGRKHLAKRFGELPLCTASAYKQLPTFIKQWSLIWHSEPSIRELHHLHHLHYRKG